MNQQQVAIYARVSSRQQAEEGTIESQLAALRERVEQDGFHWCEELVFVDEGYSGATLIRPGLERLRDVAALDGLERLYVHSDGDTSLGRRPAERPVCQPGATPRPLS